MRENIEKHYDEYSQEEIVEYSNDEIKSTKTTIPFFKNNNFDYADLFRWCGENAQFFSC